MRSTKVALRGTPAEAARRSWHSVCRADDGSLCVDWVEYRDPAPYDHVTGLRFTASEEQALVEKLGHRFDPDRTLQLLAAHFATYFDVRKFVQAHILSHSTFVDFDP